MVEMGKVALGAVRALQEPTPFEVFVDGSIVELYFGGEVLTQNYGPSRVKSASRSLRRALLMPQANTGSIYRCGKRT